MSDADEDQMMQQGGDDGASGEVSMSVTATNTDPAGSEPSDGRGSVDSAAAPGQFDLSALQISVDVCLTSEKVSVSDISNWINGGYVPLPSLPLQSGLPIEIRHGGQIVATGNLVMLDDCYAVQIKQVMVKKR